MPDISPDPLLTKAEVAVMLGVKPPTVARWARTGKLASAGKGRNRRFRELDVRALLQGPGGGTMTPAQVAALWKVDPKTVGRWETAGKIAASRTAGGHRRFNESDVRALLAEDGSGPRPAPHGGPS